MSILEPYIFIICFSLVCNWGIMNIFTLYLVLAFVTCQQVCGTGPRSQEEENKLNSTQPSIIRPPLSKACKSDAWQPGIARYNYTTADVFASVETQSKHNDSRVKKGRENLKIDEPPKIKTQTVKGKFGYYSPKKSVYGKLIHVLDMDSHSHYACDGKISNAPVDLGEPWVALIERGGCTFTEKLLLAEQYNASAVLVYEAQPRRVLQVMKTVGTTIVSAMIDMKSGKKLVHLAAKHGNVFIKISPGETICVESKKLYSRTKSLWKTFRGNRGSRPVLQSFICVVSFLFVILYLLI